MQRESTSEHGTAKTNSANGMTLESASVWGKNTAANGSAAAQHSGLSAGAPPQDWTRYIDSRLKQFCTR